MANVRSPRRRAVCAVRGGPVRALEDRMMAGVLMWVPMSLAYLVPAAVVTVGLLSSPARPALFPLPRGNIPRSDGRIANMREPTCANH